VAGNLERPIDPGRGAEIAHARSGAHDNRVMMRQQPDTTEQGGQVGTLGQQTGGHPPDGTPAVLGVVGVNRPRNVSGLVGRARAAVDHRANVEDQQAGIAQPCGQPLRLD